MSQQPKLSYLQRRAIVPSLAITDDAPIASVPTTTIEGNFPTFGAGVPFTISGAPPPTRGGPRVPHSGRSTRRRRSQAEDVEPEVEADENTPDLDNVQGDVYFIFPKKWERFLFFEIKKLMDFRTNLAEYAKEITTSRKTVANIRHIARHRGSDRDIVSTGIAFTRAGLNKLGYVDNLQDCHFDTGPQYLERTKLGDMGDYHPYLNRPTVTHGVILVAAREESKCSDEMDRISDIFGTSIHKVHTFEGRVRSNDREHFGWKDGISQPAMTWSQPKPGQRVVKPGVIIMGYPGDPVKDDQNHAQRPEYTKDGSFMVFRQLEQNVQLLEEYIDKNWGSIPTRPEGSLGDLTDSQRKLLFGAKLFGRFKSGVSLARSPFIEDIADHERECRENINNFDYTEPRNGCPHYAHVRKTEPRNLLPFVSKEYLDASVIIRAGIPYGDEISDQDKANWQGYDDDQKETLKCERGLLFVCYQSSIHNGFYRQTTGFANNDYFPITDLVPKKIGQDPIIGGPQPVHENNVAVSQEGQVTFHVTGEHGHKYKVHGIAKKVDDFEALDAQKFFVTSRGGEYFFVPSISTVKDVFTQAPPGETPVKDSDDEDSDEDGNGDEDGELYN